MPEPYKLIIADDQPALRQGVRAILEREEGFTFSGEAGNGLELLDLLDRGIVPDALILDISMPRMSGLDALSRIRQMHFSFEVLILTMDKEMDLLCSALKLGADGFMLKDGMAKELSIALHALLEKQIYISPDMARDLPDTCLVKSLLGQKRTFPGLTHCRE
jgi:two-component system, NarL family, nitrate/nitrite response regulator NarL